MQHSDGQANRGWDSSFRDFQNTSNSVILNSLRSYYPDSSESQITTWRRTVPQLKKEIGEVVQIDAGFTSFTAVLEYELPMESRRADAILLLNDGVMVIELKGKTHSTDADIDQAHAYARDLKHYHRECHERDVVAVLIPERLPSAVTKQRDVFICSPDRLDALVAYLSSRNKKPPIDSERFLSGQAYKPLPSLVQAARDLFINKRPPQIWKSVADTDDAVCAIRNIIVDAYRTKSRKLVLLTGVPGSGKTLVGLRVVHMPELDSLMSQNGGAPAILLSGNDPLVRVLQHVMRTAKSDGKTFVRHIKNYVKMYLNSATRIPSEHIVVFDEAQRAHDAQQVTEVHGESGPESNPSEPECLIRFAERCNDWSVVVGLIGSGQEINKGEEGGLKLWVDAVSSSPSSNQWTVCGPEELKVHFSDLDFHTEPKLSLDQNIRSHFATRLHDFVAQLVNQYPDRSHLAELAQTLEKQGHDIRITRDLQLAKNYLRQRYSDSPAHRFGLVASSRDKTLVGFGVLNDWQSTRSLRIGNWYNDGECDTGRLSCRHLEICITEYEAQGLELDAVLLAWGTDFVLKSGNWSIEKARKYRNGNAVRDPFQLRANAYRVLLTRGRDAHVVFVPQLAELNETWEFLCESGFRPLDNRQ